MASTLSEPIHVGDAVIHVKYTKLFINGGFVDSVSTPYDVGSLRNELRGHKQNQNDWYKYMQRGAEAVHKANPNVLVILSGLNFDTNLNFLSFKPVSLSFKEKLVFELHWHAFTDGQTWANENPNQICGSVINRGGFLLTPNKTYTAPLFISEFGIDQRRQNIKDNRRISFFLAFAAENDLDWAYWALQGSYYIRSGTPGMDETYGILNGDWSQPGDQIHFNIFDCYILFDLYLYQMRDSCCKSIHLSSSAYWNGCVESDRRDHRSHEKGGIDRWGKPETGKKKLRQWFGENKRNTMGIWRFVQEQAERKAQPAKEWKWWIKTWRLRS
eukprot:Gb_16273 [translate_table: standard]